jgi:poly [ADP-ribose] polymerase
LWESKLREKIRKGYKDQTYLFAQESSIKDQLSIADNQVQKLVESLMRYARQSIFTNYAVTADQVTRQQVEEAQALLDTLVEMINPKMNIKAFNISLLALYQVIPRKMSNVNDHLVTKGKNRKLDIEKTEKLIAEEQAVLDVMRGQVEVNEKQKQPKAEPMTLLEAMGLQIEPEKDAKAIQTIKKMMGKDAHLFRQAYKVVNIRTQQAFDGFIAKAKNKTVKLFWHGSRNENWLSILKAGLVLRPSNAVITGKMFGYGLYFADKFKKSLNYTSLTGSYWAGGNQQRAFISLYDVHTGNQMKVLRHKSWCYDLTETKLKARRPDCDSLFAKGGADLINNEYIVYNQAQCTIRYLVEVQR